MRHYSKVMVEMPDGPSDPPFAVVTIECDVCGEEQLRIHMQHLGTVLRVLADVTRSLEDDGISQPMSGMLESTPMNKAKVREFLNERFPGWKGDRIRQRS